MDDYGVCDVTELLAADDDSDIDCSLRPDPGVRAAILAFAALVLLGSVLLLARPLDVPVRRAVLASRPAPAHPESRVPRGGHGRGWSMPAH